MAITTLNITDNFSALVNKFNDLSSDVGNLTSLSTTSTSDLVAAINSIYDLVNSDLDFRSKISVTDNGGDGSLSYNVNTGVISYTGPSASEVRAHFTGGAGITITNGSVAISDNGVTEAKIADDAVGSGQLKNVQALTIYDSDGVTVLRTIYGAGS